MKISEMSVQEVRAVMIGNGKRFMCDPADQEWRRLFALYNEKHPGGELTDLGCSKCVQSVWTWAEKQ